MRLAGSSTSAVLTEPIAPQKPAVSNEHAGIDQPDRRYDERELAADRARRVVAVEPKRMIELERRMHEHEHAELLALAPERLELGCVDEAPVLLRRDGDALEAELVTA